MSQTNKSSVYLLILKEKPFFKIGKADDIIRRMLELQRVWGSFDLDKSIEIRCEATQVLKIEKTLHSIFFDHKLKMDKKLDGHTEWFDVSCFDAVVDMVKSIKTQNSNIYKITQGISIPLKLQKTELSRERTKLINKEDVKKIQKIIEANKIKAYSVIDFFKSQKSQISYFNREVGLIQFNSEIIPDEIITDILTKGVLSYPAGGLSLFLAYRYSEGSKNEHHIILNKWSNFIQDADHETMGASIEIIDSYFSVLEKDKAINNSQLLGKKYLKESL